MKKKIVFIFILVCLAYSCGKKGDPEYKGSINNQNFENFKISKV
tara:strand:- start:164 stop:295 length:132 start_codon:yes stop_codon:yes gene_type:complete